MGFSFVTSAKGVKRHSEARMAHFDRFDAHDPVQRAARTIEVAYYALELSTPLKNYHQAHSAVEKLEPQDSEASQQIIDDLLVVLKVDEMLARAYQEVSAYVYPQLQKLKSATAAYTDKNTGALAAIHKMAVPNMKLGYISPATAKHAEDLIRYVITQEKNIDLTASPAEPADIQLSFDSPEL